MEIPSSDVVRLVQTHLLELGLSESVQVLQRESGVQLSGQLVRNYNFHAAAGNWGAVLESLSYVDPDLRVMVDDDNDDEDKDAKETDVKDRSGPRFRRLRDLIAEVHEMTILELAEAGDLALAYATYRVVQGDLEKMGVESTVTKKSKKNKVRQDSQHGQDTAEEDRPTSNKTMSRARVLEQKLAALAAWQANQSHRGGTGGPIPIPDDYYGSDGRTKQQRREDLGRRLDNAIPLVPRQRLVTLLQQAVSWQAYTGQLPTVKRLWHDDNDEEEDDDDVVAKEAKSKRKRSRSHCREFDLVLGTARVDPIQVGAQLDRSRLPTEPIPTQPWSTVKLGKRTRPESAVFVPDGKAFITGSSDGLIEVWDASSQYTSLMESLEYQKREELMGHDDANDGDKVSSSQSITALVVSNDGQILVSADASGLVKVWKFETGRCLRSFQAHNKAVTCLSLAPDASHLLTSSRDGTCREFGLRTSRMLKEFAAHGGGGGSASVSYCAYRVQSSHDDKNYDDNDDDENLDSPKKLLVVTASSDGAVRIWDRASQELIRTMRPVSAGGRAGSSLVGSSIVVADSVPSSSNDQAVGSPPIQAVLPLHTPHGAMMIVPRGPRAFMVDGSGTVLQVYDADKAMVAATVSGTNQWLYGATEDGALCVFSVESGKLETSIQDFGDETMRLSKDASGGSGASGGLAEITGMVHHPNRSILAAFSNSISQKKGQVVLWK